MSHAPEGHDPHRDPAGLIAGNIHSILSIVLPNDDASVETPTLQPLKMNDEAGNALVVDRVKVTPLGNMDSRAASTLIQLSGAPINGIYKSMFGLLVEGAGQHGDAYDFKSTEIIESANPIVDIPPVASFRRASTSLATAYDEDVLYDVAFELRALARPHDVPYPREQHQDAVELLAEARISIPGIAYLGQLLIQIDAEDLPTSY